MREYIQIIDKLMESWTPSWDAIKIYQTTKSITLYHTSNGAPAISTKTDRLIPKSLSAKARSPDYLWGGTAYKFKIPVGTVVAQIPSIFDILPDGVADSPLNIGKVLRAWAAKNKIQILRIGKVGGVGTEWAILDPNLIKNSEKI